MPKYDSLIVFYFSSSYHVFTSLHSTILLILQPYDDRLQALAKAGFTLAAGIPFDVSYYNNICMLYVTLHLV